jgi:cytochrome b involved in lipid metabolism
MEKELNGYTREQVEKNDGSNGKLWIILHDKVFDVSEFKHPGGREVLEELPGEDRGDEFDSIHHQTIKKETEKYLIGYLIKENKKDAAGSTDKKTDEVKTEAKNNLPLYLLIIAVLALGGFLYSNISYESSLLLSIIKKFF